MLPKYNDTVSNSGCRIRRIWTPHFVESKLGLAEYEIDLIDDGEIDILFSSQIAEDGTPCIVISYNVAPSREYYKFC